MRSGEEQVGGRVRFLQVSLSLSLSLSVCKQISWIVCFVRHSLLLLVLSLLLLAFFFLFCSLVLHKIAVCAAAFLLSVYSPLAAFELGPKIAATPLSMRSHAESEEFSSSEYVHIPPPASFLPSPCSCSTTLPSSGFSRLIRGFSANVGSGSGPLMELTTLRNSFSRSSSLS